jgi:hypothetical protein
MMGTIRVALRITLAIATCNQRQDTLRLRRGGLRGSGGTRQPTSPGLYSLCTDYGQLADHAIGRPFLIRAYGETEIQERIECVLAVNSIRPEPMREGFR